MRIVLVSDHLEDPPLGRAQTSDITWTRSNTQSPVADGDLYIWDYEPGFDLLNWLVSRPNAQHLVVTEPKYLDELGAFQNSVCVLLKPISAFTLRVFVDLAYKNWQANRQAKEAEKLRVDRDALLQYVLEVNLKLQEYDRQRSNFLARALHDFRAPLTALHGYCGLLAEGKLGSVSCAQQELLNRMSYSTRRLARLAGGTLELLLQGRVERLADLQEADLQETVSQALHDVYPFVQDKNLDVEVDLTPPEGCLRFEPEQIQQVFVNLFENSCKFTPQNGRIQVRGYSVYELNSRECACSGIGVQQTAVNGYRVDVSDSGSGVPPELTERIFEEYASYSGVADRSGGGLGLAICRGIVTAHRGRIWAVPSDEGGRFSFILPFTPLGIETEALQDNGELECAECH